MASRHVIEVTDDNFDAHVTKSDVPVLVDFSATWCRPCQQLAPIVEELAEEYAGTYKVAKIDIEVSPGVTGKLGVRGVPTVMVFKKGQKTGQYVGFTNKEKLLELLSG